MHRQGFSFLLKVFQTITSLFVSPIFSKELKGNNPSPSGHHMLLLLSVFHYLRSVYMLLKNPFQVYCHYLLNQRGIPYSKFYYFIRFFIYFQVARSLLAFVFCLKPIIIFLFYFLFFYIPSQVRRINNCTDIILFIYY